MTKQIKTVIYGEGGFDESKPDNNIVETVYYSNEELVEQAEAEAKAAQRQALLSRLGITEEEARILLGGN
jgi:hypothetical protein